MPRQFKGKKNRIKIEQEKQKRIAKEIKCHLEFPKGVIGYSCQRYLPLAPEFWGVQYQGTLLQSCISQPWTEDRRSAKHSERRSETVFVELLNRHAVHSCFGSSLPVPFSSVLWWTDLVHLTGTPWLWHRHPGKKATAGCLAWNGIATQDTAAVTLFPGWATHFYIYITSGKEGYAWSHCWKEEGRK